MNERREKIAQAYDSAWWWYDIRGFLILTFAYNSTLMNQLRFFGPNFGRKHLEVACGSGTLLDMILKWRRRRRLPETEVTAIDYADAMLAGASKRFQGNHNVHVQHADAARLPFSDDSFDTANCANSLHSFPEPDRSLREIHRALKPGGSLAANVLLYPRGKQPLKAIAERINRWGMRKGILHTPYEPEDIRQRIRAAGFEIETEEIAGNCYNVLARKRAVPI